MRAALLLSLMVMICGMAAAFGYPAVWISGAPVLGLRGLVAAALMATAFPLAVLIWRKRFHSRRKG